MPIVQTTPPNGPGNTASDIVFNPSQNAVFVTVKGLNATEPASFFALPVSSTGVVGNEFVASDPEGVVLAFSLTFLGSDSRAVISDIGHGAGIISIAPDLQVTQSTKVVIPDQKAACWTVYAPEYKSIFVMDAATPDITVLDESGGIRYQLDGPDDGLGAYDGIRMGRYLYNLLGSAAIAVYDMDGAPESKPRLIQTFDLSSLGIRQGFAGLALWTDASVSE